MDGLICDYVDGVHFNTKLMRRKNFSDLCNKVASNRWDETLTITWLSHITHRNTLRIGDSG